MGQEDLGHPSSAYVAYRFATDRCIRENHRGNGVVSPSTAAWIALATAAATLLAALLGILSNAIQLLLARRRLGEASRARDKPAPPPAEPPPQLRSLPPPDPAFVNRKAELRKATSLIREGGEAVLAFEGSKGIGKSATAVQLAHELRREPLLGEVDLCEHEFIWVRGRNGSTTLADVGRSLRMETDDHSVSTGSDRDKLGRLRDHLATRKTALVIDDLRISSKPGSEGLRELIDAVPEGSLVIAAASRPVPLRAGCVPLEELGVEDVAELIAAQVGRLDLRPAEEFDEEFARRLHHLVGGHPETITWFLRAYKSSGETLEERLAALRRGEGLDSLFASVWRSLPADCRSLLSACDSLGGRASRAQLQLACDLSERQAKAAVERLLGEGLLGVVRTAGQAGFTCAQALGLFVGGQTPDRERKLLLGRLARHYVTTLEAAPEDAAAMLPEADAIRAIFEGLSRPAPDESFDPQAEADLQRLFEATLDVLLTLGLLDDRILAASCALRSAMRTESYRCASLAAHVLSGTHSFRGEFAEAASALGHGWLAAERAADPVETARQMYTEGFLRYRSGDPRDALRAIEGAEDRAIEGGDAETLINVLDLRSAADLHLGRVDRCEAAARRCLETCEEIEWERAKAFPLRFLAEVAIHRGESAQARSLLDRAQRFASEYRDQRQLARVALTRARLHLFERELDAGAAAAELAASEARRLGLPPEEEEARALENAIGLARRAPNALDDYVGRRPTRLTDAPVAGD